MHKTQKNNPETESVSQKSDIATEETGKAEKIESAEFSPENQDETVEESPSPDEIAQDLRAQIEKSENDYLYLRSEFENFKRNTIKERSQLIRFGAQNLALDLLNVLDVFDQALDNEITPETVQNFVEGIKMTQQELNKALEKHGIKSLPAMGETFDPKSHEALGNEPTNDFEEGKICRVFKKPYVYHDKLLRAGQVFVATKKD